MSSGIGNSALTSTTSYCLRSSFTTDHCGNCWSLARFWPPKIFTIVSTTPTRWRSVPDTTRMVRTTSYSVGRPRSKNGMTCCSAPEVNATPMKTSDDLRSAAGDVAHLAGPDAELLASPDGGVGERLGVLDQHLDPGAGEGVDLLEGPESGSIAPARRAPAPPGSGTPG